MSAPLLIHGVVAADAAEPVDAPAHRRVAVGALAALVSPSGLTGAPETDAAEAVRHNAILTAYARIGPVAPARFGAVAATDRAAADGVAAEAERHLAFLARVGDSVEIGARILTAPGPVAAPPAPAASASGGGYLRRQAALRDAARNALQRRAEAVGRLADALTDGARDWRAFDPRPAAQGAPARLAELALLAPRDALAAFRGRAAALGALAAAEGLAVEITGPWPPYSFAEPALATTPGRAA
jgi:hypothetical protein